MWGQAFGLNPNLLPYIGKKVVARFAPEWIRPYCEKFLSVTPYLITLYSHKAEFVASNIVGLMGVGVANLVANRFGIEKSPTRRECEGFVYYCFKRAGWEYADELCQKSLTLLRYLPLDSLHLLFLNFQTLSNVQGNPSQEVPSHPQCPVDIEKDKCETEICHIEHGWHGVKRCIQDQEPNEGNSFREWPKCRLSHKDTIPTFKRDIGDELYSEIKAIGGGGHNHVFEASLKQERPHHDLKEGDKIAVRFSGSTQFLNKDFDGYSRLEMVRPYTNFFVDTYGAYFGSFINKFNLTRFQEKISLHVEMENIPYSFSDSLYNRPGEIEGSFPESVFFESCIGEWSLQSIAGVTIGDYKPRHFGYKLSDSVRIYEIGNKKFLMDNEIIAKRFDYDHTDPINLQCSNQPISNVCKFFSMFEDNLFDRLKDLYKNNKRLGVFQFLFKAFKNYEIGEPKLKDLRQNSSIFIEYYKLPEDLLPREVRGF